MLPILQIGPLAVPIPAFSLLAGLWIGLSLAEHYAPLFKVDGNQLYQLALTGLLCGLLGARLAYAARYLEAFSGNPLSIFSLTPQMLDPWGGLAAGLIGSAIYAQRKGLPLWTTLNALTPALAVLSVALGVSHLASGDAFGTPSQVPWAIELWGMQRHPAQVYEILLALAVLAIFWPGRALSRQRGYFLAYIAASALARIFLEAFRGDSTLVLSGFRSAQLAAWLVLAGSLWGFGKINHPEPGEYET